MRDKWCPKHFPKAPVCHIQSAILNFSDAYIHEIKDNKRLIAGFLKDQVC